MDNLYLKQNKSLKGLFEMDPDTCLDEIRVLCNIDTNDSDCIEDVRTLIELIESLDCWLVHNGALPHEWDRRENNGARCHTQRNRNDM